MKNSIVGNRYGRLVVLTHKGSENGITLWECKCDCGSIIIVKRNALRSGYRKSCGCLNAETRKINAKNMGLQNKKDNVHRFMQYVLKLDSGCWEWKGEIVENGYGRFWLEGNSVRAHRVSFILFKGIIPKGILVCHSCDNPLCVNPEHLFLGTAKSNMEDRDNKNRQAKGENAGIAKLKDRQVRVIKELCNKGTKSKIVAELFSISISTVNRIKRGVAWKHIYS